MYLKFFTLKIFLEVANWKWHVTDYSENREWKKSNSVIFPWIVSHRIFFVGCISGNQRVFAAVVEPLTVLQKIIVSVFLWRCPFIFYDVTIVSRAFLSQSFMCLSRVPFNPMTVCPVSFLPFFFSSCYVSCVGLFSHVPSSTYLQLTCYYLWLSLPFLSLFFTCLSLKCFLSNGIL